MAQYSTITRNTKCLFNSIINICLLKEAKWDVGCEGGQRTENSLFLVLLLFPQPSRRVELLHLRFRYFVQFTLVLIQVTEKTRSFQLDADKKK